MTTTREASSENDVLYEFALAYQDPDAQKLDDFARRFPRHADALTTLAIELALECRAGDERSVPDHPQQDDADTAAILSRAMSRFQNRLYAVRASKDAITTNNRSSAEPAPRNPFSSRSREEFRGLEVSLDISPLFLKRLRDREIRSDTMTPGFIHYVAVGLEEPASVVAMHFRAKGQLPAQIHFKSLEMPSVRPQLTFEEAVRGSGLTPEQQARLLAL
jgi:hypothetical protein